MKKQVLILLMILAPSSILLAQNYKKTYQQNINYRTGNSNGKDVTLDFAVQYDAFMGEPLIKSRTKILSSGNYVMYNGKRYTRQELGDRVFDQIEIGLINVTFDIYQGNSKITTVRLNNEISVSFIPGSPDWDELWPGVSEERAKQIWKDGYSIRNARLVDVTFRGFSAIDRLEREKQREIEKQAAEEKKAAEEQAKKEKEELEKIAAEEEAAAKKAEEEAAAEEEEAATAQKNERIAREQKAKEEQEQREAAERARQDEERQRRQRINEYNDRIENQRQENQAIATSAAASSAGILFILGGVIYNRMGLPGDNLYTGGNLFLNLDFGYGLSLFPIAFDSRTESINQVTGNPTSSSSTEPRTAATIDLRISTRFGYETKYGGGNIFGQFEPGFSPIFTDFNLSYSYGLEAFGGLEWAKLYASYRQGARNFSSNNWLDPEEFGEGGNATTTYQQLRANLKFSYYRNSRTAKRDHITIGVIEDYFDEDSAAIFSIRSEPESPLLGLFSTPTPDDAEFDPFVASGYFFEWKRDHTHRLYVEAFFDYPVTGEIGGSSPEGKLFIQAGFTRTIESFFPNKKRLID
jgi:hypothetical protein